MKNLENPITFLTNKDPEEPTIIAGPCSAESKEQVMATADAILSKGNAHIFRAGIWKPRTRPNSFEGIGEEGLPWLTEVKEKYNIPVSTEVAKTSFENLCIFPRILKCTTGQVVLQLFMIFLALGEYRSF